MASASDLDYMINHVATLTLQIKNDTLPRDKEDILPDSGVETMSDSSCTLVPDGASSGPVRVDMELHTETPLSPSSTFSTSRIPNSQDLITTILFTYWDNILGPRIQHAWLLQDNPPLCPNTMLYLCGRIMSGEICRDVTESFVDYKFYTLPEKKMLVMSYIFSARGQYGLNIHSILTVMPMSKLGQYLHKHELLQNWMTRLTGKLKMLLSKTSCEEAVNEFSGHLGDFLQMLSSLADHGLPDVIPLLHTAFSPDHTLEENFLRKAIFSHLATMGRSVVIGKSTERINLMIATLGLFNTREERRCSRYVHGSTSLPYHHDLPLQGIIKGSGDMLNQLAKEILCSAYPTTIIDLPHRDVYQSPPCHEHHFWRHRMITNELICIRSENEDTLTYPKNMFLPVEHQETLVTTFLKEIRQIHHACGVRESYISQFLMCLQRKALCLIKYVAAETNHGTSKHRVNINKLKHDMSVTTPGDFTIILSTAEKLKPGTYAYVMMDSKLQHELTQSLLDT